MDISYYGRVNRFTQISNEKWMLNLLRWDIRYLFDCVKSVLIHPVDAKCARIKYDRAQNGVFHALNTTVDRILQCDSLAPHLESRMLPLRTSPEDRAILSCDHHALLFTSLVRNQMIPIRARTGYSKYIVKNMLIPHWITEIYDENRKEWYLVDPERQIDNVDRADFVFAHEAWEMSKKYPNRIFPSYSNSKSRQGIKYALICDINCIFKNELLGYEWRHKSYHKKKPSIVRVSYEHQEPGMQKAINEAAELMKNPDNNFDKLHEFYATFIDEPDTDVAI